jgi:cell division protein FtsI (penicillin-binding protein 3)
VPDRSPSPEPEPFVETLNRPDVALDARLREAEAAAAEALAYDWRPTVRRRLAVMAVLVACWIGAIEARLVYLQVVNHDELVRLAERQHNRAITVPGKRGDLVDRDGRLLAYSVDGDAIWADPSRVADRRRPPGRSARPSTAARRPTVRSWWNGCGASAPSPTSGGPRRRPTPSVSRRSICRASPCTRRTAATTRTGRWPRTCSGTSGPTTPASPASRRGTTPRSPGGPGVMFVVTDAKERVFSRLEQPPTTGTTFELTIDQSLQFIAERELEWGVAEYGAQGGTVIIMEPRTGDILALANWPTLQSQRVPGHRARAARNRAVQEVYEPGSTFKIVTASAALERACSVPTSRST